MKRTLPKIVMLVENAYPADMRVRNEATLLQSVGYDVSVVALRSQGEERSEIVEGVRVYRFPAIEVFSKTIAPHRGFLGRLLVKMKAVVGYSLEYAYFTTGCFLITIYIALRYRVDVIHAHNPPDTLFLVALPFRLLGKKFVFDHHDLSPELYRSRYQTGECLPTRMMRLAEWCTFRTADIVIATNDSYKRIEIERGHVHPERIFVVRNGPGSLRMNQVAATERLRCMGRRILVYIGALNPQDGLDYLLRSLAHLRAELHREDFYCVVIGKGDSLGDLRQMSHDLELDGYVEFTGYIPDEELQANLAAADICVDPDPSSPLNDVSTWIKIMEYMACGKPIVSFDLPETRYSAGEAAVYVQPNDEPAFAEAIASLMEDPDRRRRMGRFGRRRVEQDLQWSVVGKNLLRAYERLAGGSYRPVKEPVAAANAGDRRERGTSQPRGTAYR